jgi:hypothetical protein
MRFCFFLVWSSARFIIFLLPLLGIQLKDCRCFEALTELQFKIPLIYTTRKSIGTIRQHSFAPRPFSRL